MELEDWEHVTCLKNVSLAYEGTRSGLKGYIALGTNYNYSEDITSRGRVRGQRRGGVLLYAQKDGMLLTPKLCVMKTLSFFCALKL